MPPMLARLAAGERKRAAEANDDPTAKRKRAAEANVDPTAKRKRAADAWGKLWLTR